MTGYSVLVVDDYVSVRKVLGQALARSGFEVLLAGSGEEACEILKERSVDAVLMDLRMPTMSGQTLFHLITSRWPHLKSRVVIMTGEAETESHQTWLNVFALPTIRKPFGMSEIVGLINSVILDESREANGEH
ncbi:MAG: response regulator [Gemmatimonadales bacterium]